jgi:hypothetical protein
MPKTKDAREILKNSCGSKSMTLFYYLLPCRFPTICLVRVRVSRQSESEREHESQLTYVKRNRNHQFHSLASPALHRFSLSRSSDNARDGFAGCHTRIFTFHATHGRKKQQQLKLFFHLRKPDLPSRRRASAREKKFTSHEIDIFFALITRRRRMWVKGRKLSWLLVLT